MPIKRAPIRRFKILKTNLSSEHGTEGPWVVGKWRTMFCLVRDLELCALGYHCSDHFLDATAYMEPGLLAIVETKGRGPERDAHKSVWRDMRVVAAYRWTAADSKAVYLYVAKLLKFKPVRRSTAYDCLYVARSNLWNSPKLKTKVDAWVLRRVRSQKVVTKGKK